MWAARNGIETVAAMYIEKGANLEQEDEYGNTPLLQATIGGHEAVARLLLEKGADVKATNKNGHTPFGLALINGHESMAKLFQWWKPATISGGVVDTGTYVTPIGVVRFHIKKANGIHNIFKFYGVGVYARVLCSGIEKSRTGTWNEIDPSWDKFLYIPIQSTRDQLVLEVMRADELDESASIGHIKIFADDLVREADGEHVGTDVKNIPLEWKYLGLYYVTKHLAYTATFYWCLNIADVEDEEEEEGADGKHKKPVQQDYEGGGQAGKAMVSPAKASNHY